MVKALDCEIVVCEFNLQSPYYVRYLPMPPTIQGLTQGQWLEVRLSRNKREDVGNKPRLEPCWSVLLIGSLSAMSA